MIVQICVGSSCHLKGSEKVVELFQALITEYRLETDVTLAGSFCSGKCNRDGVTITVDDMVYTGITPDNLEGFFEDKILRTINIERM